MTARLTAEEIDVMMTGHPGWLRSGDAVARTFAFADFNEAMGFVNRVALAAEKADHHPDVDIRWNEVTLVLTTHSEGGLTEKDRTMVEQIDAWTG